MDIHAKYNHRWHSSIVRAYNSPIDRLGVIATAPIKNGEIIFMYGGVIIPRSEIQNYWKEMGHVGIQIEVDFWICPTSREELEVQGVINHSCKPNTGFSNQVALVAIEDIEVGKEITFDYAFTESFMESFDCNCGEDVCRRKVTQDDWQRRDIRDKYLEFFSPYLRAKR